MSDFYSILEVTPKASHAVIEAAYNVLLNQFSDNKTILKKIKTASETLLDRDKREKYDTDRSSGKIIDNYKIISQIAEGGFGKTYKAEHLISHMPVCLKHAHKISAQDEQLLIDEAASIWDLRHFGIPAMRNIIRLKDDSIALVMSYVPGPTLAEIIDEKKSLDAEHVAWITERIINILKYLHFHGVVHGDVKPQNIIIQPENHSVVLVDYGLSLIRPSTKSSAKGYTPYFASPEQIRGQTLLPESDFYSLGMTMIYALGGDIETKRVPSNAPDELCAFIKSLIKLEILSRPNWNKGDLQKQLSECREHCFGRKSSGMKKLVI